MSYIYSDPKRANDPHALPDVEVFYDKEGNFGCFNFDDDGSFSSSLGPGWYYAYGQIGCLWDSDPVGPFASEEAAIKAMRKERRVDLRNEAEPIQSTH
jgi:hypothetical protein